VIRRYDDADAGLGTQHRNILETVMRDAVHAVVEPAADTDNSHRQRVQRRAIADELERPQNGERDNRVRERDEAPFGQAGGERDHVLFRHPDVEEPFGELDGKRLKDLIAQIPGQEHDAGIATGELDECGGKRASHAPGRSSSLSA
jgi:hypothetical protein